MKSGYVSLIGRPNAGKSTLLNAFVGDKVAITSNKPQTTRKKILGVAHVEGGQIAFLDTPGIHKPVHRLNQRMVDAAHDALRDADVAVLVVDITEKPGTGDAYMLDLLERVKTPVIVALNKIDALPPKRVLAGTAGKLEVLGRGSNSTPVAGTPLARCCSGARRRWERHHVPCCRQ